MNNFTAIGRVGRDAETRYTSSGKAVTGFSLAVDDGWGDNKKTTWLDCSLWGERGSKVAEFIKKGSQLGVAGSIGTREHDGKTYVTLNVSDVTLVGGKQEGGGSSGSRGGAQQRQRPVAATAEVDDFANDSIPFITLHSRF